MSRILAALALLCLSSPAFAQTTRPADDYPVTTENVGHERHTHPRNPKHPVALDASRFHTDRPGAVQLPLPGEEDAFVFAVFGDRTGGPAEGVSILADAVRDVNLFEPDLVMTVGDLVQGYNEEPQWMEQMREYKGIMSQLICPWFPVAGNHDIYWRDKGQPGPAKPAGEHEAAYEMHFGPLWYAFEHKNSFFIVLYTDEGNPETGEKNFNKRQSHEMSPEQRDWLKSMLDKAKDAEHVFLFMHHPRWIGLDGDGPAGYGDSWKETHEILKDAGNVTAVFGGHIHFMRYDGPRDGIEYVSLATVGGGQSGTVPQAGELHQYHLVTVRKNQVSMASVPVGAAMDVREISPELVGDSQKLAALPVKLDRALLLGKDGQASTEVTATFKNPAQLPVEFEIVPTSADSRWRFTPDHDHFKLEPGEETSFTTGVQRLDHSLDEAFRPAELVVKMDMLAPATRYSIPDRHVPIESELPDGWSPGDSGDKVLALDGFGWVRVEHGQIPLAETSPMTVEAWFNGDTFEGRRGLVCKTEGSEYGIFVSNGRPAFSVFLDDGYVEAAGETSMLEPGKWHHLAGVYDGKEVRLYLDGKLVASRSGTGERRIRTIPLMIGADVNGEGLAVSGFEGKIDAVRLSDTARYDGDSFEPSREFESDKSTLFNFDMNGQLGAWLWDSSDRRVQATVEGSARLEPAGD